MSAFRQIHIMRSTRSTWCGRAKSRVRFATHNRNEATCEVCLQADAAEQRKEDAASAPHAPA